MNDRISVSSTAYWKCSCGEVCFLSSVLRHKEFAQLLHTLRYSEPCMVRISVFSHLSYVNTDLLGNVSPVHLANRDYGLREEDSFCFLLGTYQLQKCTRNYFWGGMEPACFSLNPPVFSHKLPAPPLQWLLAVGLLLGMLENLGTEQGFIRHKAKREKKVLSCTNLVRTWKS